jgi:hypothetical protein
MASHILCEAQLLCARQIGSDECKGSDFVSLISEKL